MIDYEEFSDMYFIAALLSYGFDLIGTDKTNPKRQIFKFRNKEIPIIVKETNGEVVSEIADLIDTKRLFSAKRLLFPPSYPDILKDLKQEVIMYRNDNE